MGYRSMEASCMQVKDQGQGSKVGVTWVYICP